MLWNSIPRYLSFNSRQNFFVFFTTVFPALKRVMSSMDAWKYLQDGIPGGWMVKECPSIAGGTSSRVLVGELRSYMPCTKKIKINFLKISVEWICERADVSPHRCGKNPHGSFSGNSVNPSDQSLQPFEPMPPFDKGKKSQVPLKSLDLGVQWGSVGGGR